MAKRKWNSNQKWETVDRLINSENLPKASIINPNSGLIKDILSDDDFIETLSTKIADRLLSRLNDKGSFDEVLTTKSTAAMLGISTDTLSQWVTECQFPAKSVGGKVNIFLRSEVISFLKGLPEKHSLNQLSRKRALRKMKESKNTHQLII